MWNKLIKSSWFYKAVLLIIPFIGWSLIFKFSTAKKPPYQYVSICEPQTYRGGNKNQYVFSRQSVFEGLVKDKGKCEYLKIPTVFKTRLNQSDIEINLPLKAAVPDIWEKHKGEFDEEKIKIELGSNAALLHLINQELEGREHTASKIKLFNLDATVAIGSALQYKVFPEVATENLSDPYSRWYELDMTIVAKDKTAILRCSESGSEKLELSNIVNISQNMQCRVDAVTDDSLSYNYYLVPSHVINRFEDINAAYSTVIKSFRYDIKH